MADQIDGNGPQGEDTHGLVRPSEILPDGVKAVRIVNLPSQHGDGNGKQRQTNQQTLTDGALVQFQPFRDYQATGTEGGVATGNGSSHHTEHGQDSTYDAQPVVADEVDHGGSRGK